MQSLNQQELLLVAGGCETCHEHSLELLESCTLQQLMIINSVFKSVILNPDLQGASPATITAALILAIQNTTF